jgi:spoIIIJ-associated protein
MESNVESILKGLLDSMGASYTAISRADAAAQIIYSISAEDGKILIGAHGDTIHAIDHIVKKIVEHNHSKDTERTDEPMFLIDVNDYRARQIRDLQAKALMMAERARSFQYDVELTPMSAYERLIVHTTLQDAPNVKTESQGEGRNRRVVIRYSPAATEQGSI